MSDWEIRIGEITREHGEQNIEEVLQKGVEVTLHGAGKRTLTFLYQYESQGMDKKTLESQDEWKRVAEKVNTCVKGFFENALKNKALDSLIEGTSDELILDVSLLSDELTGALKAEKAEVEYKKLGKKVSKEAKNVFQKEFGDLCKQTAALQENLSFTDEKQKQVDSKKAFKEDIAALNLPPKMAMLRETVDSKISTTPIDTAKTIQSAIQHHQNIDSKDPHYDVFSLSLLGSVDKDQLNTLVEDQNQRDHLDRLAEELKKSQKDKPQQHNEKLLSAGKWIDSLFSAPATFAQATVEPMRSAPGTFAQATVDPMRSAQAAITSFLPFEHLNSWLQESHGEENDSENPLDSKKQGPMISPHHPSTIFEENDEEDEDFFLPISEPPIGYAQDTPISDEDSRYFYEEFLKINEPIIQKEKKRIQEFLRKIDEEGSNPAELVPTQISYVDLLQEDRFSKYTKDVAWNSEKSVRSIFDVFINSVKQKIEGYMDKINLEILGPLEKKINTIGEELEKMLEAVHKNPKRVDVGKFIKLHKQLGHLQNKQKYIFFDENFFPLGIAFLYLCKEKEINTREFKAFEKDFRSKLTKFDPKVALSVLYNQIRVEDIVSFLAHLKENNKRGSITLYQRSDFLKTPSPASMTSTISLSTQEDEFSPKEDRIREKLRELLNLR